MKKIMCFLSVFFICFSTFAIPTFALSNNDLVDKECSTVKPTDSKGVKLLENFFLKYPSFYDSNFVQFDMFYQSIFKQTSLYCFYNINDDVSLLITKFSSGYEISSSDGSKFSCIQSVYEDNGTFYTSVGTGSSFLVVNSIYKTNVQITDGSGNEIIKPVVTNAPEQFTVTYDPKLYDNCTPVYNWKDENGNNQSKTLDSVTFTCQFNSDYLLWYAKKYWFEIVMDKESSLYTDEQFFDFLLELEGSASCLNLNDLFNNNEGMFFISGLKCTDGNFESITRNSVFTFLEETTYSIMDRDNGDINGFTSSATHAVGLNSQFNVKFDLSEYKINDTKNITLAEFKSMLNNLPKFKRTFYLKNVNWHTDMYNTYFPYLYVGHGYLDGSSADLENLTFADYMSKCFKSQENLSPNKDGWRLPNTFIYGSSFYFSDEKYYPSYEPFEYDGDSYSNDGDPWKYTGDDAPKPTGYTTFDKDANDGEGGFTETLTKDEQIEKDNEITWGEKFTDYNFGAGDITDLLNGSSNLFGFLTAAISVLPAWFLTILTAFFVTFLMLVLIKFIL